MFTKGMGVIVTFEDGREETGRVCYQRMSAASGYSKPEAVSVFLDKKRNQLGYSGTIFAAAKVRPE